MASIGLLALLDDIATLMDDVSLLTKVAAKKTAGVLGDDLALNAQQVAGVRAERELPVVWAVAKGSFLNKLILVPAALAISVMLPWLITPLLMIGGAYLCFEGFEKVFHPLLHSKETKQKRHEHLIKAVSDESINMVQFEREKIKGAIRTDFILSAEIIVIALGAAQGADFITQAMVVSLIALLMTVGVYSLVAGIVKFDDAGLALIEGADDSSMGKFERSFGELILFAAPRFMKLLSIVGTAAMFLVGGGILVHGIPFLHHLLESWLHAGSGIGWLLSPLFSAVVGILAGGVVLLGVTLINKAVGRETH